MTDFEKLKNSINPHKHTDKAFFLSLLDFEGQKEYEDGHIKAVMQMLKAVYLNKLIKRMTAAKAERHALNSAPEHNAENYRRVLELNAEISALKNKITSYKPFFDEPYFARMDLEDSREGYNSYYIGKRGDEGLEIVDWRAPLARRYYQKSRTSFSINDYDYKLILRRAIRTQNGKVLDIKNEYLSLKDYLTAEEIGGRDEAVIFDPFLKDIIESRKEKREITDIIETIQEKQYEIITLPERDEFTVQGVAGSGKTMILLHRLSYVLYNNESLRPSDVLVITPSDSFNAFIDELSTILELEKVKTSTLDKYFLNLLKNAGVDISARLDYTQPVPQELLNYIYSEKFPVDVKRKLEKIYDGVYGMFADEGCREVISVIVQACARQSAEYDKIKNASQRVRRCVLGEIKEKADGGLYYTKQFRYMFNCVLDIKEFFTLLDGGKDKGYAYFYRQLLSFYKSLKYLRRYSEKICAAAVSDLQELFNLIDREISDLKRYKIKTGNVETLTYADRIEKREQLKAEISAAAERVKRIAEDFYPLYDFAEVVRGERDFVAIGKCETTYDIARFFYRETVKKSKIKYGMSTKKLCRFDPFALSFILSELNFPLSPKYAFLFVDEAQDISPAEYEILKKVNDRAAFNIFGDLKQNVTPYRGISDWSQLGYKVFNLNLNYRNTNQIVDFVSNGLGIDMRPIGFDGEGVERIEPRSVTKYFADKNGLCAVITSECDLEEYTRKSYNVLRQTGRISKSKINIMTVYESKGLEFTAVAVADKNMTDNEKYIAYTRALKNLAIITK
ncbi:MAG: UvrD-helicase domain-containing protein [Clostridia bacterium]|nr:UvrD-helicase domain-containing protein [Clostridia bacterium]